MAESRNTTGLWRVLTKPRHVLQILAWPCFCALLAGVLWVLVLQRIDNAARVLHVGARRAGEPAIVFSRRLDAADGSFNGVVALNVRPSCLTSFYAEASFGKSGYLGIRGADPVMYAASMGGQEIARQLLRGGPALALPAGTRMLRDAGWLGTDQLRLVAWRQIGPYPLLVEVGLSADEALAPYRNVAVNYTRGAKGATWFLGLLALCGVLASLMLVRRKLQAQEIRDAYRLATEGANEGFFFLRAVYGKDGAIADFLIEDGNRTGPALGGVEREQLIGIRLSTLPSISDFMVAAEMPSQIATGRKAMADGLVQDEWAASPSSSFRGLWLHRKIMRVGSGLAITSRDISAAKAPEK